MTAKKAPSPSRTRKGTNVVPMRPPARPRPSPSDELRSLAEVLRGFAKSAETIAGSGDEERTKREVRRIRTMIVAWEQLRQESDFDARMHFAQGVDFFATVTRKSDEGTTSWEAITARAEQLVAKIRLLYPDEARRLDVALVARAIARRARGSWDWKTMVSAWGRGPGTSDELDPEAWRVKFSEWRKARSRA